MEPIEQRRAQLTAELASLKKRRERQHREREKDEKRWNEIDAELHRLSLLEILGREQGVKVRYRFPAGDRCAKLNDARGTLVAVRRTRASVDFGEHGKWNWLLSDLLPVNGEQGEVLTF